MLQICLLPKETRPGSTAPLLDLRGDPHADPALEPVQLLEGTEYRYAFHLGRSEVRIDTDKPEVFAPDSEDGLTGRLRPGLYTGSLRVAVLVDSVETGQVALEVRSRKLEYLRHYRWMLRDIADQCVEAVMERFAPSEQRFAIQDSHDAATLYQRFAFLRSLVTGESFEAAIREVLARPHVTWEEEEHLRRPEQGIPASSRTARQFWAAGPRVRGSEGGAVTAAAGVPARIKVSRTEATVDNAPNRFVKFALLRWRDIVAAIGERMAGLEDSPVARRGAREIRIVQEQLDGLLAEELFREVGDLTHFPAGNQVLQKREGYRDLFRAYLQCEVAAKLAWRGGEDVYGAGQRDLATLYEYWAFMQLATTIARLCSGGLDLSSLFELQEDGLSIGLRRGYELAFCGGVTRLGRRLRVTLWFNRTFAKSSGTSWTRPMRPDCSICIESSQGDQASFEPVWLHFDAKYRIENLLEILGDKGRDEAEDVAVAGSQIAAEKKGQAKRTDLLKMHAYRDAIRRSVGAYVLYPGTERETCQEYHEILPGLGAFALRPAETGEVDGGFVLAQFLDDVLTHVASQLTQHERGRYWVREVFDRKAIVRARAPAVPFLHRPAADTLALLGYVKSGEHLAWIRSTKRYNLRADGRTGSVGLGSRELAVDLVLLYGDSLDQVELWEVESQPEVWTRNRMLEAAYPTPRGDVYWCLCLGRDVTGTWSMPLTRERVTAIRNGAAPGAPFGAPVTVTWLELAEGFASGS